MKFLQRKENEQSKSITKYYCVIRKGSTNIMQMKKKIGTSIFLVGENRFFLQVTFQNSYKKIVELNVFT